MADKDSEGPSLELPSFGFGRRKGRKSKKAAPEAAPEPHDVPVDAEPPTAPIEPVSESTTEPVVDLPPATEPTRTPLFVDEAETPTTIEEPAPAPPGGEREEKQRRELPVLSGMAASVVTGVLVGLLIMGLSWAGMQGCEALRGTSTCGKPGYLLVGAILVLAVVTGSWLLRLWRVPDPGSTSFLAVGLTSVIALLFLVNQLDEWWMAIALPVISLFTFALSHWVTTTFIEPADR